MYTSSIHHFFTLFRQAVSTVLSTPTSRLDENLPAFFEVCQRVDRFIDTLKPSAKAEGFFLFNYKIHKVCRVRGKHYDSVYKLKLFLAENAEPQKDTRKGGNTAVDEKA